MRREGELKICRLFFVVSPLRTYVDGNRGMEHFVPERVVPTAEEGLSLHR